MIRQETVCWKVCGTEVLSYTLYNKNPIDNWNYFYNLYCWSKKKKKKTSIIYNIQQPQVQEVFMKGDKTAHKKGWLFLKIK